MLILSEVRYTCYAEKPTILFVQSVIYMHDYFRSSRFIEIDKRNWVGVGIEKTGKNKGKGTVHGIQRNNMHTELCMQLYTYTHVFKRKIFYQYPYEKVSSQLTQFLKFYK